MVSIDSGMESRTRGNPGPSSRAEIVPADAGTMLDYLLCVPVSSTLVFAGSTMCVIPNRPPLNPMLWNLVSN